MWDMVVPGYIILGVCLNKCPPKIRLAARPSWCETAGAPRGVMEARAVVRWMAEIRRFLPVEGTVVEIPT